MLVAPYAVQIVEQNANKAYKYDKVESNRKDFQESLHHARSLRTSKTKAYAHSVIGSDNSTKRKIFITGEPFVMCPCGAAANAAWLFYAGLIGRVKSRIISLRALAASAIRSTLTITSSTLARLLTMFIP